MKRAYVTMICKGDRYVPGVEALGQSLRATGSGVPMMVMATADVPRPALVRLARQGWAVRDIEPIANPNPESDRLFTRYAGVFTKLRAWDLTELDKVVFLDADTIALRNVDDLFDRPPFAAAPDFFRPECFNSGVMVLAPSSDVFRAMVARLATATSYDGGDQGFLNEFFSDWYALPVEHRLPSTYNMHHFVHQFLLAHAALRDEFLDEVRIVHYTLQKPWLSPMLSGGAELWWRAYYAGKPDEKHRWRQRVHMLEDQLFERLIGVLGA